MRLPKKCVILAGGRGTRLSEETSTLPKPMVEIGGKPMLWHIMNIYASQGVDEFIICLGYKGYLIKEYFSNYFLHNSDVTFDMRTNKTIIHHAKAEPWRVTLVDTGEESMTGGRLRRVSSYLGDDDFYFTYGDGVANVDLKALCSAHSRAGRKATVTAVLPPGRYGALRLEGDGVTRFEEKPADESGWINGGFFVLSPSVIDYIEGDTTIWEQEPLKRLAEEGQLTAYFHKGFWQPMDTLREKNLLEQYWISGNAPWKTW
jgi:glucose-1-phosphate cytidylyltransferase